MKLTQQEIRSQLKGTSNYTGQYWLGVQLFVKVWRLLKLGRHAVLRTANGCTLGHTG